MAKQNEHFHGSDLEKIEQEYKIKKEDIISFSANINPLGISPKLKDYLAANIDILATYPDRDYVKLRDSIATYTGCYADHVMVGNGATDLTSILIQTLAPKKAVIFAPTYSEYEKEISLAGGSHLYLPLNVNNNFSYDEPIVFMMIPQETDLLILCNPNNPTGTILNQIALTKLLEHCKLNDITVLIDETYIEFADDDDSYSAIPLSSRYENLIVVRGTSKFFACPGLRLGYAITSNEDLIADCKESTRPWSVSSVANVAGQVMFQDEEYIQATKELISTERVRVMNELRKISGLQVFDSHANFCLIKILNTDIKAKTVFETAIKQGLMIRDCDSFPFLGPNYFRLCFMNPEENDRLIACIAEIFQ